MWVESNANACNIGTFIRFYIQMRVEINTKHLPIDSIGYSHNSVHCCMKCPQILREKTLSEKYTVISLRIQWKLSAEGNAFRK